MSRDSVFAEYMYNKLTNVKCLPRCNSIVYSRVNGIIQSKYPLFRIMGQWVNPSVLVYLVANQ